jgi:hypothetical protein
LQRPFIQQTDPNYKGEKCQSNECTKPGPVVSFNGHGFSQPATTGN